MTASHITLECFDVGEDEDAFPPSADYKKGFEAGCLHAENSIAAKQQQSMTDVAAALSDMTFGYTEARGILLEQIQPLLVQISGLILPQIAMHCFSEFLIETMEQAFSEATDQAIEVAVEPSIVGDLHLDNEAVNIIPDPTMEHGQARLRRKDTHVMIDLPALLDALQTALHGLDLTKRTHSNG
ncbi:hypothetical protein Q4555_09325 [Octadecabacter sp. 1_MG-2023]|uniref:hypothetical protein n=1 Tax=unclassified Octadecabacter TaxID=196158 RepID=UPI001C09258E|nr:MULTISPECIES: hypothetical protein [unclassified Octadecabacter]MBU2992371.1 hypothetical protein [Octadecabacter sp. B2R22]MDO6734872.1 hypothetical protein [Octadecabacter sp. 1_MG-2023]